MLFLSSILCKSVFVHVLENKTNTFTCINLVHSSVWSFLVALTTGGQQKQDFQISGVSCWVHLSGMWSDFSDYFQFSRLHVSSRHSAFIKAFSLFLLLQVFDLLPVCLCLLMRVLCMCLCVKNSSSQQVSDMTVNISDHVDADKLQTFDRLVWDSFHSLTPKTFLQFCTWNSFRFTSAVIWGSYCMHIFVF